LNTSHVPAEVPEQRQRRLLLRSGDPGAVACEVAAAVGLTKIYNLEGGIIDWVPRASVEK
jgi:hypothetical protein